MWVVKAEVNPGLATFSLFLMLINKKKQTHTFIINKYNQEDYTSFLCIFSHTFVKLFWKHLQLLLNETATE